jgi:hypothetical protein
MDPSIAELLGKVVIPALVGGVTAYVAIWSQKEKLRSESAAQRRQLKHEFDLQKQELTHAFDLQRERFRTELKLEFALEAAIRDLLSDKRFLERKRTFKEIKRRLGGLEDDDLRKALIRAGAISFTRRSDRAEMWGLRELVNDEDLLGDDNGV